MDEKRMEWPDEFRVCVVIWEDTCSQPGWHTKMETEEFVHDQPYIIRSLGYLVHKGENAITLAQSISPTHTGELLRIPVDVVRDMLMLTAPEEDTIVEQVPVEANGHG